MTSVQREPTTDQLAAMAYADGELAGDERRAFEARLAQSPALAREVAQYQRLQVLARQAAPPEPMDHEWRRLWGDPVQRTLALLGWLLAGAGALTLLGWIGWSLVVSELELVPKLALGGLLLGAALLFVSALRARLRTRPYDPYREIQR